MRFASAFLAGALAALASAASGAGSTGVAAPSATTSGAPDPAQASMIACIDACKDGDVDCTSKCIAVPNPNASQVNQTTECVAACPQGSGTKADNDAYAKCVDGCIGDYYFTVTGTPQATGAAGGGSSASASAASGTGTSAAGTASRTGSSTASGTGTGTSTGSAASASSTSDSAAAGQLLRTGSAGLGLLGVLVAFAAL